MNPWNPEQLVKPNLARQLIETQFPNLTPVSLKFFGEGWDNTAYLVNQHLVFRFPRRQISADLIKNETLILAAIAPTCPCQSPSLFTKGNPAQTMLGILADMKFYLDKQLVE